MQRISDDRVSEILSFVVDLKEDVPLLIERNNLALDLRDARDALKIAVEALEFYGNAAIYSDLASEELGAGNKYLKSLGIRARDALKQIRKLEDSMRGE